MAKGYENNQPFNDKKIVGIIAVLVMLGLSLILLTNLTSKVLSGARTFIDGESIWSKAQKAASLSLVRYLQQGEAKYYQNFEEAISITEGYGIANEELSKAEPDLEVIREGFGRGRSNPDDIANAVWIYEYLSWTPSLQQADAYWAEGEQLMNRMVDLGGQIHTEMQAGSLTDTKRQRYRDQIYDLDDKLTAAENNFSETITMSAVLLSKVVYWATLVIGFILLAAGGFVSIRFMRNAKRWGDSVSASEQKFRDVLENTQDVVYRLDRQNGEYVYISPSVLDMLGFSAEEIQRRGPLFIFERIHPEDLERNGKELDEAHDKEAMNDFSNETEFRIKRKDGTYIWVSNRRSVITNAEGEATDIVGSVRDISERKEYEQKIDDSLAEKKILLQEIHHRVKNNLAVISGLLYLQKEEVEGDAKGVLEKTQSRINSVAMIHEKIYGSNSLSEINLAEYIDELTDTITKAYDSNQKKVTLKKELDAMQIDIVDAVAFGLTINELVSNAYKHAFDEDESGIIKVSLKAEEDVRVMEVTDNGKGLPEDFDFNNTTSLGMTLIKSFTSQLDGSIEISNGEGTAFKIKF